MCLTGHCAQNLRENSCQGEGAYWDQVIGESRGCRDSTSRWVPWIVAQPWSDIFTFQRWPKGQRGETIIHHVTQHETAPWKVSSVRPMFLPSTFQCLWPENVPRSCLLGFLIHSFQFGELPGVWSHKKKVTSPGKAVDNSSLHCSSVTVKLLNTIGHRFRCQQNFAMQKTLKIKQEDSN